MTDLQVTRLETIAASGGEYEVDAVARLTVFGGAALVVLVECKHRRNPIKRDVIMVLESKLRDTKAHTGMVFSTAPFQRGALTFAAAHKIATLQVTDAGARYRTRAFTDGASAPTPGRAVACLCRPMEGGEWFAIVADTEGEALRDG